MIIAKFLGGVVGVCLVIGGGCGPADVASDVQQNAGSTAVGEIDCPFGYNLTAVGNQGGVLCTNFSSAWGPFTKVMIDRCTRWGGGYDSCRSLSWDRDLAISARGTGRCPDGANFDRGTGYCVEGRDAFGPFPIRLVAKCIGEGGGRIACRSARWNRDFLYRLLQSR